MNIKLPFEVKYIINRLSEAGFEAYAVGGCIRDAIMDVMPKDWDITTSALPADVKKLFGYTVDTGIKHGTVTVLYHGSAYEVTTYRIDGVYTDGRHPDEVKYTENLYEDLRRRDFRMNAMAYNDIQGFVDPFKGTEDIINKEINCVGEAEERFTEDALRILRAIRFSAQLGFHIGEDTLKAVQKLKDRLNMVSIERIREELNKTLCSKHPEMLYTATELGIMDVIIPEMRNIKDYHELERYIDAIKRVQDSNATGSCAVRWGLFFLGIIRSSKKVYNTAEIKTMIKRMRFDNHTANISENVIRWIDFDENDADSVNARRFLHNAGSREMSDAVISARKAVAVCVYRDDSRLELINRIEKEYDRIYMAEECLFIRDLDINGKDLIKLGYKQGTELGEILEFLLDAVIKKPSDNNSEILKELLFSKYKRS